MQIISWKLGLFYISTIALAIGLFHWVTQYGETQLRPKPKISGQYRLKAADLPNCLQGSLLELEQSGQFINAVILVKSEVKATPFSQAKIRQQALFSGHWLNQLELSGRDRRVGNCFVTVVQLAAQVKGKQLSGKLQLNQLDRVTPPPARVLRHPTYNNGNPQTITFQADRLK
jgi:hypothetical protein